MSYPKTVFVTGCSDGGIGAAIAHAFADRGFRVFASARNLSKMHSLATRHNVTLLQVDVTNQIEIEKAVETVTEVGKGGLDYLVNNAGRNHWSPMLDDSPDRIQTIFAVNTVGPLFICQKFITLLLAARGTIVNISSVSGYLNVPYMGTYAASKKAMEVMMETLRLELLPFDVKVLSIVTATVATNGLSYSDEFELPYHSLCSPVTDVFRKRTLGAGRPKKLLSPSEYAEKVLRQVLAGSSGVNWGPGFTVRFVKFATSWLPRWIQDRLWSLGTGLNELRAARKAKSV